jgi:hypothetical protein
MKKIVFICLVFSLNATLSCFSGKKYYIKTDGTPGLAGTSWGWASNDLQAMIEKSVVGDTVFVAAGTYSGGFLMKEGVIVMGGYTANNSQPTERYPIMETTDPAKQSILSGGGVQRPLTQLAPFSIATTWNGFVIQNGNPSPEFKKGSVIYSNTDSRIIAVLYKYNPETKQGMMMGMEEVKKQWGGYEKEVPGLPIIPNKDSAKNDLSGAEHTESIRSAFGDQSVDFSQDAYPLNGNYATYWCDTLTIGGYSDWFLPSPGELQEVYDADIKLLLKNLGKNLDYPYWTSSHAGNKLAWAYCFGNGYFHPALKYVNYPVSAIHPFTPPEQPDGIYFAGGGAFLGRNGILENCIVKNNVSSSKGGGVYVGNGARLTNCVVEGNNAPEGKEIYYEPVTGIISPLANDNTKLSVYPNPVKAGNNLTISRSENEDAIYQLIHAATGRVMSKGTLHSGKNTIPASGQPGIYLLLLRSGNKSYQTKLIIN